ncbi:hypothetical protein [Ochrobactrum sp. 3-3]|uniref:hypothetical protein n=1 Tax=Ochrobactrum sp. 3-3 TaxID=1830124 RepID=UPI000DEF889A|nr:hypothetical protein [Ochrobactrum sp. 3-3]
MRWPDGLNAVKLPFFFEAARSAWDRDLRRDRAAPNGFAALDSDHIPRQSDRYPNGPNQSGRAPCPEQAGIGTLA